MGKEFYTCEYCFKEFEPKRRRIQKYCSDSCRSKAYHARNSVKNTDITKKEKPNESGKTKIEKMSVSGIGNAAAGTLAADGLKHILTPSKDRAATKSDIAYLASKIKRYHKVNNLPPNEQGALPYFDLETNELKYSFIPLDN